MAPPEVEAVEESSVTGQNGSLEQGRLSAPDKPQILPDAHRYRGFGFLFMGFCVALLLYYVGGNQREQFADSALQMAAILDRIQASHQLLERARALVESPHEAARVRLRTELQDEAESLLKAAVPREEPPRSYASSRKLDPSEAVPEPNDLLLMAAAAQLLAQSSTADLTRSNPAWLEVSRLASHIDRSSRAAAGSLRQQMSDQRLDNGVFDFVAVLAALSFLVAFARWGLQPALDHLDALHAAMIHRRSTLEAQIKERTHELEVRTQALQTSNSELERFAYLASHDLREPLRTISGFMQLLEKRYRGKLDEKADHYISRSIAGTHRMESMIEALLEYSRVVRAAANPQAVDVAAVFVAATQNLQALIEETRAQVTCDRLPHVLAGRAELTLVLQNLIANALKFRGEAPPQVHVSAALRGDVWRFSVADNGIGIDPKQGGRVFQMFARLHTARQYPGTGMGLATCKKIIEKFGGHIWLESAGAGQGTTFFFELPAVPDDLVATAVPKRVQSRMEELI